MSRQALLAMHDTPKVFDDLVQAYLSTGAGIAGMQPKIRVPDRPTMPIPTLIVKAASEAYPGLAMNEFLRLTAARHAGILTPGLDLSDDGQMRVIDRFDIDDHGQRLGFEGIASLIGLRVRDVLPDRKYQSSQARIADVLEMLRLPAENLARCFEQVAFTVMVRNGNGHLKDFGVLYRDETDIRLAPMFDVVTTTIYRYTRYDGGPALECRTMAVKLFGGQHQGNGNPTVDELLRFGREPCGVAQPAQVRKRLASGMAKALAAAQGDKRLPARPLQAMTGFWQLGMGYAAG